MVPTCPTFFRLCRRKVEEAQQDHREGSFLTTHKPADKLFPSVRPVSLSVCLYVTVCVCGSVCHVHSAVWEQTRFLVIAHLLVLRQVLEVTPVFASPLESQETTHWSE